MTINFNNVGQAFGINDAPLSYIYGSGDYLLWPVFEPTPPDPSDYSTQYTTFEFLESGTFGWTAWNGMTGKTFTSDIYKTIYYSLNNGSWTSINSADNISISVRSGDKIRVKGNNSYYGQNSPYTAPNESGYDTRWNYFTGTAKYNVYGNLMSLIYDDSFQNNVTISYDYLFYGLFWRTNIVNAANLVIPSMSLTKYCYCGMFSNCTYMTFAPKLPATTLAEGCYYNMFVACTNLTTAPDLLAQNLVYHCYNYMFQVCYSLNSIKCLAMTGINESNCLLWLSSTSATGTFTKKSGVTWPSGDSGIPTGWTVVNAS